MTITVPLVSITHNATGLLETTGFIANTANAADGNGHRIVRLLLHNVHIFLISTV